MDKKYQNIEGYSDPTCCTALENIRRKQSAYRPLIYICSPLRGDERNNTLKAQWYARFAVDKGFLPIAPHIYFPQFMRDEILEERETAFFMNKVLLSKCQELWVFGERISEGMQIEIDYATKKDKRIRYFTEDLEEKREHDV